MNLELARLAVAGNRGSRGRLLAIAAGVAVGVAILIVLWGASNGLRARDDRGAWTSIWGAPVLVGEPLSPDTIRAEQKYDYFRDERIMRLDVAALPETTVPFPGGITPPAPGEYYASPALAEIIDGTPADQLGDRYGTRAGILPDSTLVGPDALVVLIGHDPDEANASEYMQTIAGFPEGGRGEDATYQVIMIIGGIAVFFPVVLFISIVTQLGAAQRQENFATLRLIGGSPRDLVSIAAVEMAVTSLVGAILGVGLAWLLRPLAAMVPINGETSFVSDFAVSPVVIILVVVSMVVVSAIAAAWRIRLAGIGPLGGSRQMREGRPSLLRVVPLVAGIVALVMSVQPQVLEVSTGMLSGLLLVGGFILLCFGIVIIGPWLTYQLSRMISRFAQSAESVIASSRILATPAATFRSVGGLVVAVFMVSVFAGSASVVNDSSSPREGPGQLPLDTLSVSVLALKDPETMISVLGEVDGVTAVAEARAVESEPLAEGHNLALTSADARLLGFANVPESEWVTYRYDELMASEVESVPQLFPIDSAVLGEVQYLYVQTDGSMASIERVRTAAEQGGVDARTPMTRADQADFETTRLVYSLAVLAYLGIFFSVTIAGISLAVATVAAMLDRKRVLGLMRLMGMPAGSVRRIIGLEAAVPLFAVLGGSIALGFFVAWIIVVGAGGGEYQMGWPDSLYFVTLAISLILAALAISAGAGTVNRNTSLSATRFE